MGKLGSYAWEEGKLTNLEFCNISHYLIEICTKCVCVCDPFGFTTTVVANEGLEIARG